LRELLKEKQDIFGSYRVTGLKIITEKALSQHLSHLKWPNLPITSPFPDNRIMGVRTKYDSFHRDKHSGVRFRFCDNSLQVKTRIEGTKGVRQIYISDACMFYRVQYRIKTG